MKILISSFLFASIIFLIIDILWLSYSVKVFYRPQLGPLLLDKPILWAAVIFYLIYRPVIISSYRVLRDSCRLFLG